MLTDLALILTSLHTIGAALGAAGVTFAELLYIKDKADGRIDACEERHIRATFWALRWGMSLLLLSGLALIIVEYFLTNAPQQVLFTPFWAVNTLTLIILLFGFLISRSLVPLWLGGSATLVAWWMILVLDAWHGETPSFFWLIVFYVLLTFCAAGFLTLMRHLIQVHRQPRA